MRLPKKEKEEKGKPVRQEQVRSRKLSGKKARKGNFWVGV